MSLERESVPKDSLGSLRSCLVEGDAEFEQRARKVKRRALVVSIAFQTIIVAALVLFPLLSKGERIPLGIVTPIPPYAPLGSSGHETGHHRRHTQPAPCRFCAPLAIPPTIVMHDPVRPDGPGEDVDVIGGDPRGNREGINGGLRVTENAPEPPRAETNRTETKRRIVVTRLEPAMLVHRVEPVYPPLARQLHREGRVELRAIISTDGSIQSLEVLTGDPLLIQSAVAAVREWRYRPTILNGQAVEVDTHVTVIYSVSR
jgi:periplasmic protein TonB